MYFFKREDLFVMRKLSKNFIGASVLGAAVFAASNNAAAVLSFLSELVDIGSLISSLWNGTFQQRASEWKDGAVNWYNKGQKLSTENLEGFFAELEKDLKQKVIGQDKAIEKIVSLLKSHYANVFMAEVSGKKYDKGLLLYIPGPPGVGKTYILNEISKALRIPIVGLSRDEIIRHNAKLTSNLASRCCDLATMLMMPGEGYYKNREYTKFYTSLQSNGNNIYVINEVDKLRSLDYDMRGLNEKARLDSNGKRVTSSLDEIFRDFMDEGKLLGCDAQGSIVVMTSNETMEDINKLEASWVSRLGDFIVPFDYLKNSSDCIKCVKLKLSEHYEEFFKKSGTSISFDDESLKNFIDKVPLKQRTGRYFKSVVQNIGGKIYSYYIKNKNKNNIAIRWSNEKGFYVG